MHYQGRRSRCRRSPTSSVSICWSKARSRAPAIASASPRSRSTAQRRAPWARSYEDNAGTCSRCSGIAAAIAAKFVARSRRAPARDAARVDPAVYDLYLRGRYAWNMRTPRLRAGEVYFQQAIDKDPEFALGYAGLADIYQLAGRRAVPADGPARARAAAERALALDDNLAEAHASLAGLLHRPVADIPGAEAEFRPADRSESRATPRPTRRTRSCSPRKGGTASAGHADRAVALDPLAAPMCQTLALVH